VGFLVSDFSSWSSTSLNAKSLQNLPNPRYTKGTPPHRRSLTLSHRHYRCIMFLLRWHPQRLRSTPRLRWGPSFCRVKTGIKISAKSRLDKTSTTRQGPLVLATRQSRPLSIQRYPFLLLILPPIHPGRIITCPNSNTLGFTMDDQQKVAALRTSWHLYPLSRI